MNFEAIQPYTRQSRKRVEALIECLSLIDINQVMGDVVECGVWRGGSIILARKLSPTRRCWLYDTFDGMTRPEAVDVSRITGRKALDSYLGTKKPNGKWMAVSLQDVIANLMETETYDPEFIRCVIGPVEQTLFFEACLPKQIALLRLDTDWHASTKVELERLYPRLTSGGFLIVDDYGHWAGCHIAVNDYFAQMTPAPLIQWIDETGILVVKP